MSMQKSLTKAAFTGAKVGLFGPMVAQSDMMRGAITAAVAVAASEPIADAVGIPRQWAPVVAGGAAYAATVVPALGVVAPNGGTNALMYAGLVAACDATSGMIAGALGIRL